MKVFYLKFLFITTLIALHCSGKSLASPWQNTDGSILENTRDTSSKQPALLYDTNEVNKAGFGDTNHFYREVKPLVSYDGRKIAFEVKCNGDITPEDIIGSRILDLQTGRVSTLKIKHLVPSNVELGWHRIVRWCPYNSDLVLLQAYTVITDSLSRRSEINFYIASLDGTYLQKVTPKIYPTSGRRIPGLWAGMWRIGSSSKADSIDYQIAYRTGYQLVNEDSTYIWQQDRFYPNSYSPYDVQSRDGKYIFGGVFPEEISHKGHYTFHLNGTIIELERPIPIELVTHLAWSPDSRTVAISAYNEVEDSNGVIVILDIEKYLTKKLLKLPSRRIEIQDGSRVSHVHAEFLTNSTLVISARIGRGEVLLWEIDMKGKILRKLTPENEFK